MTEPKLHRDQERADAPNMSDFVRMAETAFRALPDVFRRQCANVSIRIEDFPDQATLREMGCASAYDLLGLFRGRGLAQREATPFTGELPNMIWLYRRPILSFWRTHDETLQDIVTHVLVHELGHHFGLSDDDIDAIERAA